jgi:signal transduction histidine kinase
MAVLEEVVAQTNVLRAEQQAAVFAETEAARRAMWEVPLAWGLLIAIAALSTTAIAIRSIAQPVERLTEVAQRLAGGNLEERVQIEWADEFGRLATAFNEMTDQLQVSYAGLEQRVAERTAELEQANEEVKQFAYIVSHDLRAPLTNLKGFSEELCYALEVIGSAMDTALPHLDEKQRQAVTTALQEDVPDALGFIDSSVTRMDHFINALLKLSRLGRRELWLEPIDMGALVQATLQTLAHQIEERQVSVTVGPLPEVVADRTSMEQIMGNLLTNAVMYLDPDRPGEIEVAAERDHDETTFHVRDNGRGIAEEDMPKVFAPFRRAGKQDVPGEGMGLAYVQTLVRRHGGRIWFESEPGVGTTFTFTISNHLVRGERGDAVTRE